MYRGVNCLKDSLQISVCSWDSICRILPREVSFNSRCLYKEVPSRAYVATVCELVCVLRGDPPTTPAGGDFYHLFTEGHAPSSLLYCSHHLEEEGGEQYILVPSQSCAYDVQYSDC